MAWTYKLRELPKLIFGYLCDGHRFSTHALNGAGPMWNREAAQAHLLRLSHALEKGMALPQPKPGFGKAKAEQILEGLEEYLGRFGADDISDLLLSIVLETLEFHQRSGAAEIWEGISEKAAELRKRIPCLERQPVGLIELSREKIEQCRPRDPAAFFNLRRSVRQFDERPVSRELIEEAIRMARQCPSVCNRQTARVHVYTDPAKREEVLSFQDGNAGFGHECSVVFIITSDLTSFYKSGERNQGYVDGGIFAMALAMAIHSLGLGSCMLNWSMGARRDYRMRRHLGIPDSEIVITMMGAGHIKDQFVVAASPRRPLEQIVRWGD